MVQIGTVGKKLTKQTTNPGERPHQRELSHALVKSEVSALLMDPSTRYIVFDQLEDLLGWDDMEECLTDVLFQEDLHSKFFWFILNPLEDTRLFTRIQASTGGMSLKGFQRFTGHIREIVYFQTRIRNTKSTSAVLGMLEQRPRSPPPSFPQTPFNPVSAGHTGLPVYVAPTCHETNPVEVGRVCAEIVRNLVHKLGIDLQGMTVILPGFYDGLAISDALREVGWRDTPTEDYKYFNLELLASLSKELNTLFPSDPKQGELNSLTPIPVLCLLESPATVEEQTAALEFVKKKFDVFIQLSQKITLLPRAPGVYLSHLLVLQALYNDDDTTRQDVEDRLISYLSKDPVEEPTAGYWNYDAKQLVFEFGGTGNPSEEKARGILLHHAVVHLLSTHKPVTSEDLIQYTALMKDLFSCVHDANSLSRLLNRYLYLQTIDADRVRGSESDVVVACVRMRDNGGNASGYGDHPHVSAKVSRAKALAIVVLIACADQAAVKRMWPGPYHDWKSLLDI